MPDIIAQIYTGTPLNVDLVTGDILSVTLYQTLISGSAGSTGDFATNTQLTNTGNTLFGLIQAATAGVGAINGLSGLLNVTGLGGTTVTTTGQLITISGISGISQSQLDLSGLATKAQINVSGFLTGSIQKVTSLNTLTGIVLVTGVGSSVVSTTGQIITVTTHDTGNYLSQTALNNSGFALQSNLQLTGAGLQTQINNLSAVTVTGSSIISTADVTGLGLVTITKIGNSIYVSGAGSTGAGEVNTASNLSPGSGLFAQKSLLDLQFKGIYPTGGLRITGDANTLYLGVTGDFFPRSEIKFLDSGNMNLSGFATRDFTKTSIDTSGFALQSNLATTGANLQSQINGTGNLNFLTSAVTQLNTLQNIVQVTGLGNIIITTTGQIITVSGNDVTGISSSEVAGIYATKTNVSTTGANLQSQVTNIISSINTSGNLTGISITGASVTNLVSITGLNLTTVTKNNNEIRISSSVDGSGFVTQTSINSSGLISRTELTSSGFVTGSYGTDGFITATKVGSAIEISGNTGLYYLSSNSAGYFTSGNVNSSGFATRASIDASGFQTGVSASSVNLSGYELLVSPADVFGWTNNGGSTTGNSAVPIYWTNTTSTGDNWIAIATTTSISGTAPAQTRYAYSRLPINPASTGWGQTGIVIKVISSFSGTQYNNLGIRITSPTGAQLTQTGMFSNTATGVQTYVISGSSMPTFSMQADWTIRYDFSVLSGAKMGFCGMWRKYDL